jgi:hypothetical protein
MRKHKIFIKKLQNNAKTKICRIFYSVIHKGFIVCIKKPESKSHTWHQPEIFVPAFFSPINHIWVGDLGTVPTKLLILNFEADIRHFGDLFGAHIVCFLAGY